jgi:hypothetical protein
LKLQFGTPGMLPDPSSVSVTFVPSTCPLPDAEIVRPLPQTAVKVPAIDVAVCDAIWYWKLPHVFGDGSDGAVLVVVDCEVQMPTSDVLDEAVVPDVGFGLELLELELVGASTLDACSNPQAPNITDAASAAQSDKLRFMVTNLSIKRSIYDCLREPN